MGLKPESNLREPRIMGGLEMSWCRVQEGHSRGPGRPADHSYEAPRGEDESKGTITHQKSKIISPNLWSMPRVGRVCP